MYLTLSVWWFFKSGSPSNSPTDMQKMRFFEFFPPLTLKNLSSTGSFTSVSSSSDLWEDIGSDFCELFNRKLRFPFLVYDLRILRASFHRANIKNASTGSNKKDCEKLFYKLKNIVDPHFYFKMSIHGLNIQLQCSEKVVGHVPFRFNDYFWVKNKSR